MTLWHDIWPYDMVDLLSPPLKQLDFPWDDSLQQIWSGSDPELVMMVLLVCQVWEVEIFKLLDLLRICSLFLINPHMISNVNPISCGQQAHIGVTAKTETRWLEQLGQLLDLMFEEKKTEKEEETAVQRYIINDSTQTRVNSGQFIKFHNSCMFITPWQSRAERSVAIIQCAVK